MIFGEIENAIIEHLKAASAAGVLGYHLKQVDTLPSDIDRNLAVYIKRFPAAWTVWTGYRRLGVNGDGSTLVEARFNLVVGASSQRNEKAQRHGVAGEVGAYQLAADLPALIAGQTFGLPIGELVIGDCSSLYSAGQQDQLKASMFGIGLTCEAELAQSAPFPVVSPEMGEFLTLAVGWDLPPHSGAADLAGDIHPRQDL